MKKLYPLVLFFLLLGSCSEQKAFLVDGRVSSKEEVDRIDSTEIFSFDKLRPPKESSMHGDKGNEATIISIKTKAAEAEQKRQMQTLLNLILDLAKNGKEVLIVLDGIPLDSAAYGSLRGYSDQLSSIFLIAEKEAKVLYGSTAKPITLVINTYSTKEIYKPGKP